MTILPANFHLRQAAWTDLESIVQLIYESCKAEGDITLAASADDLRRDWQTSGFNLETDSWVVADSEGRLVGYQDFVNQHAHASLGGYGYVHPQFKGLGIGATLLAALDDAQGMKFLSHHLICAFLSATGWLLVIHRGGKST